MKQYSDPDNPGPGTYTDDTLTLTHNSVKYSLQPRTIYMNDEQTAIKRGVPGPGTYQDKT